MDAPLATLLENISLSGQLNNALLLHEGDEGKVLGIVEHYERAEWDLINWSYLQQRNINPDTLSRIYLEALTWVANTMNTMGIQTNK
jgi:EAL and modified HD-GYP domain-containing signal transduction protein